MFRLVKKACCVLLIGTVLMGDNPISPYFGDEGPIPDLQKTVRGLFGGSDGGTMFPSREYAHKLCNDFAKKLEKKNKKTASYKIVRVKDGDTYVVSKGSKEITVRLIGVDTPESVHNDESRNTDWGKKVSNIVKKKIKAGTKVTLSYDKSKKDKYGRTLAYVYMTGKNGKYMINKWLVKKGYARAAYYAPNGKHKEEFEKLEAQAKENNLGFWADGYNTAFPN